MDPRSFLDSLYSSAIGEDDLGSNMAPDSGDSVQESSEYSSSEVTALVSVEPEAAAHAASTSENKKDSEKKDNQENTKEGEEEEEEEETCGFCKFMKAGPCGTIFKDWEKCVDAARENGEDFASNCVEPTKNLKECMENNADYYGPILEIDKENAEEKEKERERRNAIPEEDRYFKD
mmetsp:Transcript_19064/g.22786  ORF Transcript_19064/g.22786 Transcript_19064/m.22786 type:complete len:177 (+) Transcript_19064:106-636(+)|eukprot:CAMPEP_0197860336 /NCGR_PEP_ID=MMETSP1438-20131217/35612_1 /TAXON_ID=1461541 /ORGANISM="Pterosperma sp., Strain CCMP1384" /LENGTH=176 /DNA_ID=CAMNT_0043477151 /DNA_START=93 /DNA_END=623 /DNA_ORIENTATION=+